MSYLQQPGTYQWSQPNWPLTYSKWAPSQPIKTPGGGCVSLEPQNGQWSDSLCNNTYPFICKITTGTLLYFVFVFSKIKIFCLEFIDKSKWENHCVSPTGTGGSRQGYPALLL